MSQTAASSRPPEAVDAFPAPVPGLVHLTGKRSGQTVMLKADSLSLGSSSSADVHLPSSGDRVAPRHATLERSGSTYELRAEPGQAVYVNTEPETSRRLDSGDVLEIGDGGPRLRFKLYKYGARDFKTMSEALADCVDCARTRGSTRLGRAGFFLSTAPRELVLRTAPRVRSVVWLGATLLVLALVTLAVQSARLERQLESERVRVEGLADLLANSDRLGPEDLAAARAEIEADLTGAAVRLEAIETRLGAARRVIAETGRSVVFLQGSYSFTEPESGRKLRFMLGPDGQPLTDDEGAPMIGLPAKGPLLENFFTGTAFVVSADGLLLTNRHVARPWEFDETAQRIAARGLEPTLERFQGYVPDQSEPFEVIMIEASDNADVAVLRCGDATRRVEPLPLATADPAVGDEVIVLGYPTGMRALLARADVEFVQELMASGEANFWTVARQLAATGQIAPLATRGIVGQVSPSAVVYDADTTSGGSGGPVLDLEGRVVAVNAAILPEFGGANLGVPIAEARKILPETETGEE